MPLVGVFFLYLLCVSFECSCSRAGRLARLNSHAQHPLLHFLHGLFCLSSLLSLLFPCSLWVRPTHFFITAVVGTAVRRYMRNTKYYISVYTVRSSIVCTWVVEVCPRSWEFVPDQMIPVIRESQQPPHNAPSRVVQRGEKRGEGCVSNGIYLLPVANTCMHCPDRRKKKLIRSIYVCTIKS